LWRASRQPRLQGSRRGYGRNGEVEIARSRIADILVTH
jgi:hypothetical protein